jgi:hypothetical protein
MQRFMTIATGCPKASLTVYRHERLSDILYYRQYLNNFKLFLRSKQFTLDVLGQLYEFSIMTSRYKLL